MGGNYDVLTRKQAADAPSPNLTAAVGPAADFARWVFLESAARDVLVDWEPEARGLLARLRALAIRHPGDPRYTCPIDELNAVSLEMCAW